MEIPEALINLGLASLGQGEHERAAASFQEALVMSQNMGRTPKVIEAWRGWRAWPGPLGKPPGRHTCGGPPRRHARSPASIFHARRVGAARTVPGLGPFPAGRGVGRSAGRGAGDVARRGLRVRPHRREADQPGYRPREPSTGNPWATLPAESRRWPSSSPGASPTARYPPSSRSPSARQVTTSRGSSRSLASVHGPRSPPRPLDMACSGRSRSSLLRRSEIRCPQATPKQHQR